MLRSTFLVLASLAITASCYNCSKDTTTLNPPSDLSQPQYYPPGFSDGQPYPSMDPNLGCFVSANIPTGYYANVTFYRDFPEDAGSYVLSSANQLTRIVNGDSVPFVFIYPYFRVSFSSENQTDTYKFAMKIVYTKLPQVQKKIIPISNGNPPVAVSDNEFLNVFVGNPNSMMTVMAFNLVDPTQTHLLRQTAIFAGDTLASGCIGSLENVLYSKRPLVTYGHKISVYTFGLSNSIDYPLFMSQDYEDIRFFGYYEGANCPNTGDCHITLYQSNVKSMKVTDYNGSEYIKGFDIFHDTSVLDVYQDNTNNSSMVASLNFNNYKSLLPLEVKGTMKFYQYTGFTDMNMIVTRDVSRASRTSH